jgi:hypothetical protein
MGDQKQKFFHGHDSFRISPHHENRHCNTYPLMFTHPFRPLCARSWYSLLQLARPINPDWKFRSRLFPEAKTVHERFTLFFLMTKGTTRYSDLAVGPSSIVLISASATCSSCEYDVRGRDPPKVFQIKISPSWLLCGNGASPSFRVYSCFELHELVLRFSGLVCWPRSRCLKKSELVG